MLRANELVTSDRLVEELWGESPPATAQKMLHNQVSALRRALGRNGRLETQGSGYRLKVDPGELDVARFEELVARGRAQIDEDPGAAAETLRQALGLWRGPALSDLAYEQFAQGEIGRLEEQRWAAFEARCEAELALGRHAELVGELEAAVAEQPLRERLRGQLMLALYRCGRQAEALEAYRRARATLVEEVGVEPGAELRRPARGDPRPGFRARPAAAAARRRPWRADPRCWRGATGSWPSCASAWPRRARAVAASRCSCTARPASARPGWRRSWRARRCARAWSSGTSAPEAPPDVRGTRSDR